MTALHRKPIETVSAARIVGLGVVGFTTLAVLSLLWWTFSPTLGRAYAALRLIETISLWRFTGWGRYFTGMPAGRPFAFVSIYQSSVGFGLVAALLTALIGYLAWRKRSRDHIDALITYHPRASHKERSPAGSCRPTGWSGCPPRTRS